MRNQTTQDPLALPCWIWGRAVGGNGYGAVGSNGRTVPAHRFVFEALVGPIPDGMELDHLCRTPRCVNPDHLEPVTRAENARRRPYARIGHDGAAAIRRQYAAGVPMRLLAAEYGVSCEAIRLVVNGITWRSD